MSQAMLCIKRGKDEVKLAMKQNSKRKEETSHNTTQNSSKKYFEIGLVQSDLEISLFQITHSHKGKTIYLSVQNNPS